MYSSAVAAPASRSISWSGCRLTRGQNGACCIIDGSNAGPTWFRTHGGTCWRLPCAGSRMNLSAAPVRAQFRHHLCHKPYRPATGAGAAPALAWWHGVTTLPRRRCDSRAPIIRSPRPRSASGGVPQGAAFQGRNGARGTRVSGAAP